MMRIWIRNLLLVLAAGFLSAGCAHRHFIFNGDANVETLEDRTPIAAPSKGSFNKREYLIHSSVRRPLIETLKLREIPRSLDVNAMDQVPASSWYTPRLGYRPVENGEMIRGPGSAGAPEKPVKVLKVKDEGSAPGFLIEDARGLKYLIKLDTPGLPGLESSVNFVVNRLFWAMGYNVPEDSIFYFHAGDLAANPEKGVTREMIEETLFHATAEPDGRLRVGASLFVQGKVLGHTAQAGVRRDDPNDRIRHEHRRSLRALYVFCSLFNLTGIRSDNTLDVYQGEGGEGYVEHYLIDFGEAFGVHGFGYGRLWDGYDHFFSWDHLTKNVLGLGIRMHPWQDGQKYDRELELYYRSEIFDPGAWREAYPFQPVRNALADDNYWAAKIAAEIDEKDLRALFEAARYEDREHLELILRAFKERREKLLTYHFNRVTPLESRGMRSGELILEDMRRKYLAESPEAVYEARYFDRTDRQIAGPVQLHPDAGMVNVPLEEAFSETLPEYLRLEIQTKAGPEPGRPAEFHFKPDENQKLRLIGVVH